MKKLMRILILFVILLSLCACGAQEGSQATTEATQVPTQETTDTTSSDMHLLTPEDLYGHINQMELVDGVYKIWNAEGVKNIANHPDANFELLCNIDMGGAVLAPIGTADKPFTGELKGGNFTISNFTVQGSDETDFGFVAVNKGTVRNLVLDQVTFLPGALAKSIGALVGTNEGTVNRCNVTGEMTVEQAAEDAACGGIAGTNTGSLSNVVATVDTTYTAEGAACVGGLVGVAKGGTAEYLENHGKLTVTGTGKTTGLFAGQATDVVLTNCLFSGADNSLDGKLFVNFTGNADDDELAVAKNALWRDNGAIEPLPENVLALRDKVVQAMYDLCTVEWHVSESLVHSCTCQLDVCHGTYNPGFTYYGIPYNHKSSSLARFTYCLNEDKTLSDWIYDLDSFDGFDVYIGTDCSSTVQQAWWTVSNSTDILNTAWIPSAYDRGTIAVGDYKCDFELTGAALTDQYIKANEEHVMYESYAQMRHGDVIVNRLDDGGHTRMIASDPVIIRDQAGIINPNYSYVLTHEQGSGVHDYEKMISSSCKVNWKYTFANLYESWYCPFTCEELLTGEMEPVEAKLEGGCDGYGGMLTGTVKANYHLDYVTLTLTDAQGNEVLDHPIFCTVSSQEDFSNYFVNRNYVDWMNLADFAVVLAQTPLERGESYSYTITAALATFDQIVVHEGSFTYGA